MAFRQDNVHGGWRPLRAAIGGDEVVARGLVRRQSAAGIAVSGSAPCMLVTCRLLRAI